MPARGSIRRTTATPIPLVTPEPFPAIPPGITTNTMNELTTNEYETVTGGLPPLVVALLGATFLWADTNWADIKRGAIDGWRDATR